MVGEAEGQQVADLGETIRWNADRLLQGAGDDTNSALVNLVAATVRLAQDANAAGTVREKIAATESGLRRSGFIDNDQAYADLMAAYAALNDGSPFAVPTSVHDRDSAIAYGKERLAGCLSALDARRHKEATRELMEFILMVITPLDVR
jgi:hypothetical protein